MKRRVPIRGGELTLAKLLANLRRARKRIEEAPVEMVREAQKRGFPDMRSILLPPPVIRASLAEPLLRDLLITRIGYCSRAAGHFIPRPEGSLDHILIYGVAGVGWLRMGGREWAIPAETVVYIPAQTPHTYGADENDPWSLYWIHFTGRQADDYFAALGVGADEPLLHLACTEDVLSDFEVAYGHMAAVHTRVRLIAAATALARFLGMIQLRRHAMERHVRTEEENIQQTIDHMRRHLDRPLTLHELANLAHMSVSRYDTVFAKRTGCPPIAYFNRMRIQRASRLLQETSLTVKEIAGTLGFEDPYYFSRLFKKHAGVSPAHFNKTRPAPAAAKLRRERKA
jgi:AraC family transcriptional regulator, arabinose operon regulatory protein